MSRSTIVPNVTHATTSPNRRLPRQINRIASLRKRCTHAMIAARRYGLRMTESLLTGFEIVASDNVPAITLDNQRRFYINTSARRLMGVSPYERLAIAYNPTDWHLAVIRPTAGLRARESVELATSNYAIDKRYYTSARHFAREYGYDEWNDPYTFVYERGASAGSVFVFRLVD